jgi:hypothetical protein
VPADLTVVSVRLPPRLVAPCPVPVRVVIENVGSDPADRTAFDVTIDLAVGEGHSARFVEIVRDLEDQQLGPGRVIVVTVMVQFPCTSPVVLRATVDQRQQISNNLRTAPFKDVTGLVPTPVPWLTVTMQVGVRGPSGIETYEPEGFCPGKVAFVFARIDNNGCAISNACVAEMSLEDANATPLPLVLGSQTDMVRALRPGDSHFTGASFNTPNSVAGTSGALGIRVRADINNNNPDQCDPAALEARVVKPFSTGGPPQPNLTVAGAVHPGEIPSLSWRIHTDCSDVGEADVKILFSTPPTELYRTRVPIRLRTTVGEDVPPPRLSIPSGLWTVGAKTLTLEITGTGSDPGPYTATALLNVVPEPIDTTWWTWAAAPPTARWKSTYAISGSFANRASAPMTLTALSTLEHPTDVTGTAEDQTVTPLPGVIGTTVAPGTSSAAATWLRRQSWPWLTKGTPIEVGPRARTFSYIANLSLIDGYGNTYPAFSSAALSVAVPVSPLKVFYLDSAQLLIATGTYLLVVAAAVGSIGGYAWIAAAVIAAIAMALLISGTLLANDADDPPIPDFGEHEPPTINPRAWTIPETADESLHPLETLALLVTRVVSARVQAVRYRDLAWAAYLDRDDSMQVEFRDRGRTELETLRRLVGATIDTADEAHDKLEELLDQVRTPPTSEELRDITQRFTDELHLTDAERALVDERLQTISAQDLQRSLEIARSNRTQAIGEIARMAYATTAADYAEREHLH